MRPPSAEARRSRAFLALVAVEALAVLAAALLGAATAEAPRGVEANRRLVSRLQLTDLALWGGASYCRHPSQADLFAPHADHPAALEHFPAGSWVPPRPAGAATAGKAVDTHPGGP